MSPTVRRLRLSLCLAALLPIACQAEPPAAPAAHVTAAFDLDASAFLLNADGKVRSDADFIFYNQKKSSDGSIEHQGDNLTGASPYQDSDPALAAELPLVG